MHKGRGPIVDTLNSTTILNIEPDWEIVSFGEQLQITNIVILGFTIRVKIHKL